MSDENNTSAEDQLILASATAPDEFSRYTLDCNRVWLEGSKTIPGFEELVKKLGKAEVTTHDFLIQALEVDNPAKVLHTLGQDVELAKKVAALPPVKRAAAFAAIERGEAVPEPRMPAWKVPKAMRHEDQLDDESWFKQYGKRQRP